MKYLVKSPCRLPCSTIGKHAKSKEGGVRLQDWSCKWLDTCPMEWQVNVVSNMVVINLTQGASRWLRAKRKRTNIQQPLLISHYNKTMGGVDRMDHYIEKYRVGIRWKKWWWSIFFYGLGMSVQQGWHLYRLTSAAKKKQQVDLLGMGRAIIKTYQLKSTAKRKKGSFNTPGCPASLEKRVPTVVRFDTKNYLIRRKSHSTQSRCGFCGKKTK